MITANAAGLFRDCSTATALRPWSKCIMLYHWVRPARGSMLETRHDQDQLAGQAAVQCSPSSGTQVVANRQEQRTSSLALRIAQVEVQLCERITCGTLAAASSSNLVGGEITSTCRPTQALRSGCAGLVLSSATSAISSHDSRTSVAS